MKYFNTYSQFLNEGKVKVPKTIKKGDKFTSVDHGKTINWSVVKYDGEGIELDNDHPRYSRFALSVKDFEKKVKNGDFKSVNERTNYRVYLDGDYEEHYTEDPRATKAKAIAQAKEMAKNHKGKIEVTSDEDINDVVWTNESVNEAKVKVGDILYKAGRKGKVVKVMSDMVNVDFGGGDVYGIMLRRIKGDQINESVNEAKEITKNIKDVEDGDVVILGRNKHFKVDYIDPWSAGGRILVGKDVKTGKKAKLKIKFLTARGNTGLADDTMVTVLESITEGYNSFKGKMKKDLTLGGKMSGKFDIPKKSNMPKVTFKQGEDVELEIQPNSYHIYGKGGKHGYMDKQLAPQLRFMDIDDYVIYESVNENVKDKAKEIFDELMNINGEEIADMDKTECMHTLKMRGITGRKANEICKELLKMTSNIKESVTEGSLPKKGTMVKLQPSVNLISFMDIKDQDLEVIGYKKTGLISGPSEFLIVKDAKGKKHEINPEYIEESVNEAKMPVNKENIEHYIGAYGVDDDPYDVALEIGGQYGWTQRDIEKAEKLIRKHYIK